MQWQRLPAWKRKTSQDAVEFAHTMIISRPDLTDFECPLDRFLVLRAWLNAEQRSSEPPQAGKRGAKSKAARGKALLKSALKAPESLVEYQESGIS